MWPFILRFADTRRYTIIPIQNEIIERRGRKGDLPVQEKFVLKKRFLTSRIHVLQRVNVPQSQDATSGDEV